MPEFPLHGSPYFDIREWVDRRTWTILGHTAAWLIDPRAVRVADLLRRLSGAPIMVNNWHYAKKGQKVYDSSGFRAVWDPEGGTLSQHRCGRAGDLKNPVFSPRQLFEIIMDNEVLFRKAGLTTMEDLSFTKTWLHCDCRPVIPGVHPEKGFLIVQPV